jgi:hypothetical protein
MVDGYDWGLLRHFTSLPVLLPKKKRGNTGLKSFGKNSFSEIRSAKKASHNFKPY